MYQTSRMDLWIPFYGQIFGFETDVSDNIKKENYYPTDITNFNKIEFTEDKIKIEKFISNE